MTGTELERQHQAWVRSWRDLQDFVQRTKFTLMRAKNTSPALLSEQEAQECLRLARIHQETLEDYVNALQRFHYASQTYQLQSGQGSDGLNEKLALSIPETARALGISRSTLYQMMGDGRLPVVRIGRRVLVPKAAIIQFLAGAAETL